MFGWLFSRDNRSQVNYCSWLLYEDSNISDESSTFYLILTKLTSLFYELPLPFTRNVWCIRIVFLVTCSIFISIYYFRTLKLLDNCKKYNNEIWLSEAAIEFGLLISECHRPILCGKSCWKTISALQERAWIYSSCYCNFSYNEFILLYSLNT